MNDRSALLHAIAEHPGDDTPRLAYADWLDEHAADLPAAEHAAKRAEFIRAQIAAVRLSEDDPARHAAAGTATALLAVYRDVWFPPVPRPRRRNGEEDVDPSAGVSWPIERGFATVVSVGNPLPGWAEYVGRLVAAEPVGELTLSAYDDEGNAVAELAAGLDAWPRADRLRRLNLNADLQVSSAERLGRCPNLVNLRRLHVQAGSAGPIDALADGPVVGRLTGLTFRRDWRRRGLGTAAAFADLFNRTAATEVTFGNFSDAEVVEFLGRLANPAVAAVSAFELGSRDPVLVALCASPVLPRVRSLDLRMNYWSARQFARFLRDAPLHDLRVLRASHAFSLERERADEVWRAIVGGPFAARLTELDVGWRPGLTARELAPVADGRFPELRVLSVGPGEPGDAWVEALARGPCGPRLTALGLWECGVTERGAKVLAENFPALERLDVRNNAIGPATKARLATRFGRRLMA